MARINYIELNNFRNFDHCKIFFEKKLNILTGINGSGKTNILESISLTSKGRGIRNANLSNFIKNNQKNFLIKNNLIIQENNYDIKIYVEELNEKLKKITKINEDVSKESIDFLNNSLSYLIFIPEMERLFQSSPSYRRNFIDRLIFSTRSDYNRIINRYKKCLLERNKILQNEIFDEEGLNQVENDICNTGIDIYKSRVQQLNLLNLIIKNLNTNNRFKFNIKLEIKDKFFNSDITFDKYLSNLKKSRPIDKYLGGAKFGPHKSDIISKINEDFDASLLSTGQQKTIVLLMLLAQCDYLVNSKKIIPILLFDEICSHLDSINREILLDMINMFDIQFFLTGTDKNLFSFVSTKAKFYNITDL